MIDKVGLAACSKGTPQLPPDEIIRIAIDTDRQNHPSRDLTDTGDSHRLELVVGFDPLAWYLE